MENLIAFIFIALVPLVTAILNALFMVRAYKRADYKWAIAFGIALGWMLFMTYTMVIIIIEKI